MENLENLSLGELFKQSDEVGDKYLSTREKVKRAWKLKKAKGARLD